jgi:polar amino acid transport system permease protein
MTLVLASVQFDWALFFHRLFDPTSQFWNGLVITISVAIAAQIAGVLIGGVTVVASRSWRPLRILAFLYVLVFRGTPVIVQVFFLYFGANIFLGFTLFPRDVDLFGWQIQGAIVAGMTALAINEGAYMSEIIRAGVDAVDAGQMESALSIGMTRRRAMRHIVLPQAAKTIVPPLGNQFNGMIKATSLLAFIGVTEIFQDAQITYSANFQPVEVLAAVAVWYLALTIGWTLIQMQIERKLGVSDSGGTDSLARRMMPFRVKGET